LSILHSNVERQLPRDYADFGNLSDIERRLKTASCKTKAGKKRARIASTGVMLGFVLNQMRAIRYCSLTQIVDFEHSARHYDPTPFDETC